jgi:hypothetical protein
MEFRFVQEPFISEINNYIRQRREHITFYTTTHDVRAELLRSVAPGITQADMYPKARQLINDEEYLYILRDMFNLSNVLDDMEFTGAWAPAQYQDKAQHWDSLAAVSVGRASAV